MAANEENPKPIEADDDVSLFARFISKLYWDSIYLQEEKEMATITVHVKTPKEKKSISVGDKSSVKDVSKNCPTIFTFFQYTFHFHEFFIDLCHLSVM